MSTHHCPNLLALDVLAAAGDPDAARVARWHEDHPAGPQSAEEYAEAPEMLRSA